ncbi:nuclear autoantigenic sperm protein isoform X2 [Varanus komodoensis]|uniref:nuclear autoantigenic sperm protein isoform X2 n=1 Tax=Varanus komodoensis TaxID=61221 RepID=UPI001CF78199|nr:nuclear autoantigenic sperm protein isoform X2 [Varanus komodoensis]
MAEDSAAPSTSADTTESMDVDGEAKKLLGLGQKNLVMGDIPAAVNAFQEAASLLGKKYGETANECAEAFFYYGKSLLELARMENGVLGNALEGVQVEEEEEKTEDLMVESADNIDEEAREELREQVYNAMGEKDESRKTAEESVVEIGEAMQPKNKDVEMEELVKGGRGGTAVDGESNVHGGRKEQEKTEKQIEGTVQEKEGDSEIIAEEKLEDGAAREIKSLAAERAVREEETVAEAVGENITIKSVALLDKAAGETEPMVEQTAEVAGEDAIDKQAVTEEKSVLEKIEEVEKQLDPTIENNLVEELVKDSGEAVEEKECMTVEKVESRVEKGEQPTSVLDDKSARMEASTEQVVELKEKELKEPSSSRELLPSATNENIPAGVDKQLHEIQTEEKAEVASKVEKEEEKDDKMGEGEETEGSDEEDKAEEDKENDSTVEEKESEEDEVGNLELAWDMLELAKVIYKRQDTKEAQLHAAQAHLKLGEVSIESENYIQAVEEFHSCLTLQQKYLEAHDRLLAETHYHLGLAYHYNNQYDEAVLQFTKSMEVIDKRMVMLTERLRVKGEGSTEDEKEIEELKGLLPEIKEKIEDSKESQKSARMTEMALKATLVGGSSSSFSQGTESSLASTIPVGQTADGTSQCITDISHLVRKKTEGRPQVETVQSAV